MKKQRYRRTFVEKYGCNTIISKEECNRLIKELGLEYKKVKTNLNEEQWVFDRLPYLGILYCSAGSGLWYDTNLWNNSIDDKPLIRNKVIEVSETGCVIVTIDDHNGGIAIIDYCDTNNCLIEGNVCKRIDEFNR